MERDLKTKPPRGYGYIYKLVNTDNDWEYIGSTTCSLHRRLIVHISAAKCRDISGCVELNKDIREFGVNNFQMELIETVLLDQLEVREYYHISTQNTIFPNGYNLIYYEDNKKQYCLRLKKSFTKARRRGSQYYDLCYKLPMFIGIRCRNGEPCGVRINRHPRCESKSFEHRNKTYEENLTSAINYMQQINVALTEYERDEIMNISSDDDIDICDNTEKWQRGTIKLPRYLSLNKNRTRTHYNGYLVAYHNIRKVFGNNTSGMGEKLTNAIEFMKVHNIYDKEMWDSQLEDKFKETQTTIQCN
jgi:hypothetical protein